MQFRLDADFLFEADDLAEFTHAYAKRLEKHVTPPEAGAKRQPRRREA
jgi:hypothetical protein